MEKITSFTIDHLKLKPGVYVSRKDSVGAETITTFDLRLTSPNNRTFGSNIFKKSRNIRQENNLFRSYGMPYRILSSSCRRLCFF